MSFHIYIYTLEDIGLFNICVLKNNISRWMKEQAFQVLRSTHEE